MTITKELKMRRLKDLRVEHWDKTTKQCLSQYEFSKANSWANLPQFSMDDAKRNFVSAQLKVQ